MSTLICFDGSDSARRALAVAQRTLGGGPAVLLHVYHPPEAVLADAFSTRSAQPGAAPAQNTLETLAQRRAQEVIDDGCALAAELGLAVSPREARAHGPVWKAILEVADELDVELIVVGTHGTTAVAEHSLGSVSDGLVHHARRPILIVPAGHRAS
jgi:nucleotide-binding universal stress UspA family protein